MAYDNEKFVIAFNLWVEENITLGFGDQYAGDLLDDFDNFLRKTKLMKSSPGRVAFGMMLATIEGLEKHKKLGLTFWRGIELVKKPERDALEPKRYQLSRKHQLKVAEERRKLLEEQEFEASDEAEAARIAAFKHELESETAERVRSVGEKDEV